MSATALDALTASDLLAKMNPVERAALKAQLSREPVRDKSYLLLPMGREVGRYLAAKRKELTASSFVGYESCLDKLARKFGDLELRDFELPGGAELIEPWMDERWGEATPGTYNVNHAILRDFFRWQVRRGRLHSNPMDLVGRARVRDIHRSTFSDDARLAMLAAATDLRDRIAIRLFFDYGLRKGSFRKVQFKHFDFGRRQLTVFSKGGNVRDLPIPDKHLWYELEQLCEPVGWAQPEHFLAYVVKQVPYGKPDADGRRLTRPHRFPDRPMANTTCQRWWDERLADAGLVVRGRGSVGTGRTLNMHAARHTAGQRMLNATQGNLKAVQKLLGHSSIQTTADVYVDWDNEQLRASLVGYLGEDEE